MLFMCSADRAEIGPQFLKVFIAMALETVGTRPVSAVFDSQGAHRASLYGDAEVRGLCLLLAVSFFVVLAWICVCGTSHRTLKPYMTVFAYVCACRLFRHTALPWMRGMEVPSGRPLPLLILTEVH